MEKKRVVKILVIDEDTYIRDGIKCFLEDYSYEVIEAENGMKGLELFEKASPDLVLCDLIMQEMDGFEVLETIVRSAPEIPMIIVSGADNISDTVKTLKMGAWDYIIKPVQDMNILLYAIEKSIERVSLIKEKDLYKIKLLNQAVEAGRSQLSAMILHNIGNAITPVSVYTERLKTRNSVNIHHYIAQCYYDLLEHKEHLTEYITTDSRGVEVLKYMGTLVKNLEIEDSKTTDIIDKIATGIEYVAQILTLQRTYSPGKATIRERININLLINDALKMQEILISRCNIDLKKSLLESMPHILIERHKLMQVIVNLIKNSCDAIEENRRQNGHVIEITTYCNQDNIGLRITDSGIGVDVERQNEIFDFGISSKGSSGFGLYYCKSFVEANSGTLTLESPGRYGGSTVTMEMPFIKTDNLEKR